MANLERWYNLEYHEQQDGYFRSDRRFNIVYAGRRSGKTEVAKRRLIKRALLFNAHPDGYFFFGAPTSTQARDIYWSDLKRFVPRSMRARTYETDHTLRLVTGTEIRCLGLDVPERAEGRPVDGCVLDEYANMKSTVWTEHLRPAVDTRGRPGWVDFIGVPEGRNHFYQLVLDANADDTGQWQTWHWFSSDILEASVIEAARRDLDPLIFQQEYEGSFVSFLGRAYYGFDLDKSCFPHLPYNPDAPLIVCLDFNVAPGVAVICQEVGVLLPGMPGCVAPFTAVIGEVYIETGSNTELVAQAICREWGTHRGEVHLYGDATGAIKKTQSLSGSDWDIVGRTLDPVFGNRVRHRYGASNPSERARVNALNTRLRSGSPESYIRRLYVDPIKAPKTAQDLDSVSLMKDGSGAIDKKADRKLTHLSDALGYYVTEEFPVFGPGTTDIVAF